MEKCVTVVTVCRNAEKTIKNAIESVLKQTSDDFEYLIIDGNSLDKTYDIVLSYDRNFKSRGICYRHISENDNGIWDAMNKGINLALGRWIIFINADDKLHDENVLKKVFGIDDIDKYDVVYGDTLRVSLTDKHIGKAMPINMMTLNMPFCHQGSFTKREIMKRYMFDTDYRVADYNFFLSLYLDKGKFLQIDEIIADYSMEGYSNQNKYKTFLGTVQVRHDHGLINMKSWKQKIKNIYFRELLIEESLLHGIIIWIDSKFSRRGKREDVHT